MGFSISSSSEDNVAFAILFTQSPQATNLVPRAFPLSLACVGGEGYPNPILVIILITS